MDDIPFVVPAKAGTQRRKHLYDVRPCDERAGWIPACAGMTKVARRADCLNFSELLRKNGTDAGIQGAIALIGWPRRLTVFERYTTIRPTSRLRMGRGPEYFTF